MTQSSLMGLLRLAHGVLDFLISQPEERVLAFTEGRTQLAFVSPIPHQPEPAPVFGATARPAPEPTPAPMFAPVAGAGAVPAPEHAVRSPAGPEPRPVTKPSPPPSPQAGMSDEEAAAIAEQLRACETEAEGLKLLNRVATNNPTRRTIAAALNIEVTKSMTSDHLKTLILRHAIGARRTFAGLSSW
ncbi:hypothetical protein ACIA8K_00875 [Catenuloplanes sp. NPDC051500]|uniref:hypothetical protein n=1 Tax=Catenuloplanes sp. NPDC051500 TaxID=3363959 RepID=UPI0037A9A594